MRTREIHRERTVGSRKAPFADARRGFDRRLAAFTRSAFVG